MIPEAARTTPAPLTLWVVPVADLGGVARHVLDVARVGLPGLRLGVMATLRLQGDTATAE